MLLNRRGVLGAPLPLAGEVGSRSDPGGGVAESGANRSPTPALPRKRGEHTADAALLSLSAPPASPPAQPRRHVLQDRLDDMHVVVDTELIGHGEQHRVSLGDRFVHLELLDQHIRLGGVAPPEDRA